MPINGFFKNTSLTRSIAPAPAPAPAPTIVRSFAPIQRRARSVTTQKFVLSQNSKKSSCKSCGS